MTKRRSEFGKYLVSYDPATKTAVVTADSGCHGAWSGVGAEEKARKLAYEYAYDACYYCHEEAEGGYECPYHGATELAAREGAA